VVAPVRAFLTRLTCAAMTSRLAAHGIGAARDARTRLGLPLDEPLPDVLAVVEERAGVPVALLELEQGLGGAYLFRRGRPVIFLNGAQAAVRLRFTLAHELGHHCLGHSSVADPPLPAGSADGAPAEVEANHFAAEFLAPRRAVRAWAQRAGVGVVGLDHVVGLAAAFGMSAQAARIRLESAGVLRDRARVDRLDREIAEGQHWALAAHLGLRDLDDGIARARRELPRLPPACEHNALFAYAVGALELEDAAARLGRDPEELRAAAAELGIAPPG